VAVRGERKVALNRRNFLGAAAGATLASAMASPIGSTGAHAYDPGAVEAKARYRETEHIKAYYRTNGYESLTK
jgi:nitrous oxide reductase